MSPSRTGATPTRPRGRRRTIGKSGNPESRRPSSSGEVVATSARFPAADCSRIPDADLGRLFLDRPMQMLASLGSGVRGTLRADRRHDEKVP